jgi:ribosomal subunit interface protein
MNITARAHDFELSDAIAGFARDQLHAALNRFSDGIIFVDVYMKDTNGPRGGADKQVLVRVRLRNRQLIATETTDEDLYAAIRRGAKRTKRVVRRTLRKSSRIEKRRLRNLRESNSFSAVPDS